MNDRKRLKAVWVLDIVMFALLYGMFYLISLGVVTITPLFWACNLAGLIVAYLGSSRIIDYALALTAGNEKQISEFVDGLNFAGMAGRILRDPTLHFRRYVQMAFLFSILFILFDALFFLYLYGSLGLQQTGSWLNVMYFAFTVIGLVLGLPQVRKRLRPVVVKFSPKKRRGEKSLDQLVGESVEGEYKGGLRRQI